MNVDYSTWHEDHRPVARVIATCAHHRVLTLAEWGMTRSGEVAILGRLGWRPEYVGGWVPSDEEKREIVREARGGLVFGFAVGRPLPGQPEHDREIVECLRESCSYRAEIGLRGQTVLTELLRQMCAAGVDQWVVELNALFSDPDAEFRSVAAFQK